MDILRRTSLWGRGAGQTFSSEADDWLWRRDVTGLEAGLGLDGVRLRLHETGWGVTHLALLNLSELNIWGARRPLHLPSSRPPPSQHSPRPPRPHQAHSTAPLTTLQRPQPPPPPRRVNYLILYAHPALVPFLPPITPSQNPANHEAMGDFSSSSPSASSPSPLPRHSHRSDVGLTSRPRTPAARPTPSHARPHRRSPSDAGCMSPIPSSSNLREISPRTYPRVRQSHVAPVTVQTPPSRSKVRSYSAATLASNDISPVFRLTALGHPTPAIHAHQSGHAPTGCTTQFSPPLVAQVPDSLNPPPSLSSSLTSPAPSLTTPPTPQSHRFPLQHRRRSAFVTPSPSVSSFRGPTRSCEGRKARCEPSPSPLSHAAREARRSSHR